MEASASERERLARLEGYLRQDPGNRALLADACDAAIACGAHEAAQRHIDSAERLGADRAAWTFRRARLALARSDLADAAALLQALHAGAEPHPAIAHDLAYVRLLQGNAAAARTLVEPWLARGDAIDLENLQAVQVLWLRAMHALQLLDEAWNWVARQESDGRIEPAARGFASLIALDRDDLDGAARLAQAALAVDPAHPEALLALGCVALARADLAAARTLLGRALERLPDAGRVASALGFAHLQGGDATLARPHLESAVRSMPEHGETWQALGWCCLLQGDHAGARAAFEAASALDPEAAEVHGALALASAIAGDRATAERHVQRARALDPDDFAAGYAGAVLRGDASDAQRLAAAVIQRTRRLH